MYTQFRRLLGLPALRAAVGVGVGAVALSLSGCAVMMAGWSLGGEDKNASRQVAVDAGDPQVRKEIQHSISKGRTLAPHANSAGIPAVPAKAGPGVVTVRNFVGEATAVLGPLAKARGLQLRVLGPTPHLPLFVTVDVDRVTFEEAMSVIGHQFGERARLVLTDSTVDIRYTGRP